MKLVHLFQKDTSEARKRAKELKTLGYRVRHEPVSPEALRKLKEKLPAAVLIDLNHAPSLGRDAGIFIRHYRATRNIPIVFFDGESKKVTQIKKHIPDAVYTEWRTIKSALKCAIARPPTSPVKPISLLAGYSSAPLVKKLGIKPKSVVVFINAPCNVEKILVDLPEGVVIRRRLGKNNDMMIWFVVSQKGIKERIRRMVPMIGNGGLWIAWPKKNSTVSSDLSQKAVRDIGLSAGLVDYKVCSFDKTWAGLKFTRRK